MNDEQQIIEPVPTMAGYKKIPTFKLWIANQFPYIETDFDAITNYELLQAVIKYLNTIIENENNVESNVTALYNSFVNLHDYVENFFENLDVQDEINNKLDEMVADGTIESILLNYSQVTKVFDTYNDMIFDASTFVNGMKLKTLGYHFINDDGGAEYFVTNVQNNNRYQVSIGTNLWIEMIIKDSINVKQFGSYGDGVNDDALAIQNTIDLAFNLNIPVYFPSTNNFYKVTQPIILHCARDNQIGYWCGNGSHLIGENISKSRIVKIGNNTDSNIDSTIIAKNSSNVLEASTGITLENLSIENYDDITYTKNNGLAIWCDIPRSTLKNLNIIANQGIIAKMFSSLFENIVFKCNSEALHLTDGTSNTFRFLYAPQCMNPYYISSNYSELLSVCTDDSKGSLFKLAGMGLSLISCGCESKKAQYIFEILNDYTTLSVRDFYMVRQIGDAENSINLNDCAVFYSTRACIINIDGFSIAEFDAITDNSYFFKLNTNGVLTTYLKALRYYKNFLGSENPKLLLWSTNPMTQCIQRIELNNQTYSYIVTDTLKIVPFIGGYQVSNLTDVQGNILNEQNLPPNKTIWLDNETKYTGSGNYSNRFIGRHQVGDLQLFNNPKQMNAMGLSVTSVENNYTWDAIEIPLVLRGASSDRPTQNLFIGLQYFDTTLGKPIWYNGSIWVDSTGSNV